MSKRQRTGNAKYTGAAASTSRRTSPPHRPTFKGVATAILAAQKLQAFDDPITLDLTARAYGIRLDKKMYNTRALYTSLGMGMAFVPHTMRPLTPAEIRQIRQIAVPVKSQLGRVATTWQHKTTAAHVVRAIRDIATILGHDPRRLMGLIRMGVKTPQPEEVLATAEALGYAPGMTTATFQLVTKKYGTVLSNILASSSAGGYSGFAILSTPTWRLQVTTDGTVTASEGVVPAAILDTARAAALVAFRNSPGVKPPQTLLTGTDTPMVTSRTAGRRPRSSVVLRRR